MAIKLTVGNNTTIVKKVVVGIPTGRFISSSTVSLDGLSDVIAVNPDNGQFIAYDSDTDAYQLYSFADSTPRQAIRSLFSASGDLTYDSATGQFSFDVEQVYTKANFDSDFNMSIDEAALGGVGLTYDSATNTLSIDSSEFNTYFLNRISTNLIPASDSTYDLGDSTHKWRSLYLSGNTIVLGTLSIKDSDGSLAVRDEEGFPSRIDLSGNTTADLQEYQNLYYTTARFDSDLQSTQSAGAIRGYFSAVGDLTYNQSTGQFSIDVEQKYTKANFDSDLNLALSTDAVTTTDLTEGDNLYYTRARFDTALGDATSQSTIRGYVSVTDNGGDGSLSYDNSNGVFTYTGPSATEVRSHFSAGGDLSYDSATGQFSFDVEQVYTKTNFDSDFNLAIDEATLNGTGLSYDSATNTLSITDTGVVSGTYGSTTQVPVFTVNAQGQIDSIGEVLVAGVTSTSYDSATGVFTINTADGNSFTTTFHDSDDRIAEIRGALSAGGDLSYNPSTGQFSFDVEQVYTKANFDSDFNIAIDEAALGGTGLTYDSSTNTLNITDTGVVAGTYGSTTQVPVFTVNAQGQIDSVGEVLVAGVTSTTYDSATGVFTINTADGNSFATTFHDSADHVSRARTSLSVTDVGGDGSLIYNSGTGVFTYTGPSASEVRAHFSGGTGVDITSGVVSIGQPVATTSDVTFAKITGDSAIVDGINLNQTPTQYSTTPGALYFDSNELHGLSFVPRTREGATNNVIHLGQQSVIYVHNQTGEAVNRGDVVYISGTAHGSHPKISKAQANGSTIGTIALASTDIADNAHGYVTRFGLVEGLNTDGLVAGDDVYLSKDTAGGWTTTEVSIDSGYPIHIGKIVAVDATEGTILVDPFTEHFEYLRIEDRLLVTGKIEGDSASISQIDFNTLYAEHIAYKEGSVWYDNTHKTLNYWGDDSNVVHEIGIEEHQRVYNNTGSTITKGQPLYFSGNYNPGGGVLAVPTVGLADATDVNAYNAQGLAAGDILNNSYGYCLISGQLDGVNTQSLSADTNFFVGLTPGAVQNASPTYPNYPMCLGWVVRSDATDGVLLVNQQNHSVNSFRVRTSAHIGDDLTVEGNLIVNGTQTITSTENVQIGGNIQYLNAGNTIGEANTLFVGGGLDDAFFAGHYSGDSSTKYFYVKIDSSGPVDTFEWGHDSTVGPVATGITITGAEQTLTAGISIDFGATTGHTTGDKWTGTATATDTDTGFFSNRNTGDAGDGYTHLGLFFDVSENKWRLLDAYDSEPEAPINITSPSLSYGTLVVDTVEGNLTGDVTGNADTATQLANNRAFSITGDITAAGVNFNGTGNVVLNAAITAGSIVNADINASAAIADTKLATISTAGKVQNGATTATSANTASAIVARDASGNFSAQNITSNYLFTGGITVNTSSLYVTDNVEQYWGSTTSDVAQVFDGTKLLTNFGSGTNKTWELQHGSYGSGTNTITFKVDSGDISATTFTGDLVGNASSADSAYHALSADSATVAASAIFATNATYADSSTSAASAIFATNATYADSATNATNALVATNVTLTNTSAGGNYYIPFATGNSTGDYGLGVDAGIYYNPSTNTLYTTYLYPSGYVRLDDGATSTNFVGFGNSLDTKLYYQGVANKMYMLLEGNSTSFVITPNGFDERFVFDKDSYGVNGGRLTLGSIIADSISATTFTGALVGNADTATAADSAYHALSADSATNATTALVATNVAVTNTNTFGTYYVPFISSSSTGNQSIYADTNGPTWNPSLNLLTAPSIATTTGFLGIDNVQYRFGSSTDAVMFYDGVNNTMEMELEADAQSFIITDNGTTRFTFDKDSADLRLNSITLDSSTPLVTTDKLYNVGGTLYFNGSTIGGGGGLDSAAAIALIDSVENATTALVATNVSLTNTGTNASFYIPFVDSSGTGNYGLGADAGLTYNPFFNRLSAAKFEGVVEGSHAIFSDYVRLLGDNDYVVWGGNLDAKMFYDGVNNTMELELEADAQSFIITDNGTTKFTFTKSTGDLSLDTVTLADSTPAVTTNKLYNVGGTLYFNGSTIGGGGGGGASVTTSPTTPSSPSDGDLWFDETSTSLFLYYQDSDTSQWVQVGGGGGGGLSNAADSGTGVTVSGDLTVQGNIFADSDVTASNFNTTSDARIKTNVRTIYDALDKTMQLRGVYFDKNGKPDIGLIAQEVEEVMPMVVNTLNDEMQTKTVNYSGLVGLLVQAIKSQQEQINDLTAKVNRLME